MDYYSKIYTLLIENVNSYGRGTVARRAMNKKKYGKDVGFGTVYGDELPKNLRHSGGKKIHGRKKAGPQDKGIGLHKNLLGKNHDRSGI